MHNHIFFFTDRESINAQSKDDHEGWHMVQVDTENVKSMYECVGIDVEWKRRVREAYYYASLGNAAVVQPSRWTRIPPISG